MEFNLLSYIFRDFKHDVNECPSSPLFLILALILRLQPIDLTLSIQTGHADGDS